MYCTHIFLENARLNAEIEVDEATKYALTRYVALIPCRSFAGAAVRCRRSSIKDTVVDLLSLFGIAVALAMDAFAVSLTTGVRLLRITPFMTLRMAGVFGGFQFAMPVIGWSLGSVAQRRIEDYDHWLAFALLAFVGGKMLWDAWARRGAPAAPDDLKDPTVGGTLWMLGVATSLDALAVGISLAMLGLEVLFPAVLIGVVCFAITVIGLHLGGLMRRLPGLNALGEGAAVFGGLVLIAIGITILQEHGVFS